MPIPGCLLAMLAWKASFLVFSFHSEYEVLYLRAKVLFVAFLFRAQAFGLQ
jgi:hypothetical protein